jgi:hypothetical protein
MKSEMPTAATLVERVRAALPSSHEFDERDQPDATTAGRVRIRGGAARPRDFGLVVLAGPLNDRGIAPRWRPLEDGSHDEQQLAKAVRVLGYCREDWSRLVADAWALVAREDFCRIDNRLASVLARYPVLRGEMLEAVINRIQEEQLWNT